MMFHCFSDFVGFWCEAWCCCFWGLQCVGICFRFLFELGLVLVRVIYGLCYLFGMLLVSVRGCCG